MTDSPALVSLETFVIGSAEAIEAEYGASVTDGAFGVVSFYNGEIADVFGFASLAACKVELDWVEDRSIISYL